MKSLYESTSRREEIHDASGASQGRGVNVDAGRARQRVAGTVGESRGVNQVDEVRTAHQRLT